MEKKQKQSTENFIKDVCRKTPRLFYSEQKILIVMKALQRESSTVKICRKHGIHQAVFYKWNKEFMEAGYHPYYNDLKGKSLKGRSFIVPRSFGYHIEDGETKPGFSQGAYTIDVKVRESSKDVFISKVISENTSILIDAYKEKAIRSMDNKN